MQTIQQYAHNGSLITVTETHDAEYARQCFDGPEREWTDIAKRAENDVFFIVACGLAGCYMADDVCVFADKDSAISYAKDTLAFWEDEDADADAMTEEFLD